MAHIFSVFELTSAIKETLEPSFPVVWVRGQVSNISRPASGHIYFTLKDEQAALSVAWFKNTQSLSVNSEGGRLADSLEDGQEVLCAGRISVYPPRGSYQLIPELVQEKGVGRLHMQFEALKEKLKAEGLFSSEKKLPLPYCPTKIGVVTSPSGAALQDFLRVSKHYGLGGDILVYPARVQGEQAEGEIAAAVSRASQEGRAQVLVLIRGGGSLEDLWPFNTEGVARAVHGSGIPVLAGVGHEVDTTIVDLVADRSAATPTHAAQTLWPEKDALRQRMDELLQDLQEKGMGFFQEKERELDYRIQALNWLSPLKQLHRSAEKLEELSIRLYPLQEKWFRNKYEVVDRLQERLRRAFGPDMWRYREHVRDSLSSKLLSAGSRFLKNKEMQLSVLQEKFQSQDPYGPLRKGYALVRKRGKSDFLRDIQDIASGDVLDIQIRKGEFRARVLEEEDMGNVPEGKD